MRSLMPSAWNSCAFGPPVSAPSSRRAITSPAERPARRLRAAGRVTCHARHRDRTITITPSGGFCGERSRLRHDRRSGPVARHLRSRAARRTTSAAMDAAPVLRRIRTAGSPAGPGMHGRASAAARRAVTLIEDVSRLPPLRRRLLSAPHRSARPSTPVPMHPGDRARPGRAIVPSAAWRSSLAILGLAAADTSELDDMSRRLVVGVVLSVPLVVIAMSGMFGAGPARSVDGVRARGARLHVGRLAVLRSRRGVGAKSPS